MTSPTIGDEIAIAIRSTIEGFGWSQRELARRLGTNESAIRRLLGRGRRSMDVELATSTLRLLGIRLQLDTHPIGLADRARQRDAVHARCVSIVAAHLRRHGWQVRVEVEIGEGRFRGWIDVLAWRPDDAALLVGELKTAIDDAGGTLRTLSWYGRSARAAAASLGWRPRTVRRALLVLATTETEERISMGRELFRSELPGHATELGRWLDDPSAKVPQDALAMLDPTRRGSAWLRPARVAGSRAIPPYRDYSDAAAKLGARR